MKDQINKVRMTYDKMESIIQAVGDVRIGIIGDGCLDVYWYADMRLSELSREPPHYPLPIVKEKMYPGGGANVAVNAATLGAKKVYMLSLIGRDWRGDCLSAALKDQGIDTKYMLRSDTRITPTYCKPIKRGYSDMAYEDPRLDFDNHVPLCKAEEAEIIENLREMAGEVDVIAVCDQLRYGVITEGIRQELASLAAKGKPIAVDSRLRIGAFSNVIIKPNDLEAFNATEGKAPDEATLDAVAACAEKLHGRTKAPVIITMGSKGALWYDGSAFSSAEAVRVPPPIDIVGAGDAFLAAFSCAYAAGFTGPESIGFASIVSSVVVKKLGMTGSATPQEIREQYNKYIDNEAR